MLFTLLPIVLSAAMAQTPGAALEKHLYQGLSARLPVFRLVVHCSKMLTTQRIKIPPTEAASTGVAHSENAMNFVCKSCPIEPGYCFAGAGGRSRSERLASDSATFFGVRIHLWDLLIKGYEQARDWFKSNPDSVAPLQGNVIGALGSVISALLSLVGAIVAALIGFAITYMAFVKVPAERARLKLKIETIDLQLRLLYGPLMGECIRTDRIFLRIQKITSTLFASKLHHSEVTSLLEEKTTISLERSAINAILEKVYLPCNKEKTKLLKSSVHLFGPSPPLSFHLFLRHAAEMEALISIYKHNVASGFSAKPASGDLDEVCSIAPFPIAMTAEVAGKIGLLQRLKEEFSENLARVAFWNLAGKEFREFFGLKSKHVFSRKKYFLEINKDVYRTLCGLTKQKIGKDTLPLLWGPYLAAELVEMRSWFMQYKKDQKEFAKEPQTMADGRTVCEAFLQAKLVINNEIESQDAITYPCDYRAFQIFDSYDPLETKRNMIWDVEDYQFSRKEWLYEVDESGKPCTLVHLPTEKDFVYNPKRFHRLHKGGH